MSNAHFDDHKVVKKPVDDEGLTPEQAEEFKKCALDYAYWARNYLLVQGQTGEVLFEPRSYQMRFHDALETNQHVIGVAGRQSGKSIFSVGYILHQMIFRKNYRVGITSYTLQPNLKDLANRFRFAYENLPWWMKPAVREYNQYGIRFTNNSSVVFQVTKGNTFRGLSLDFVMIDELAHVKPDVAEEFFNSLFPSIMAEGEESNTRLFIISTPNGSTGVFARLWADAVNGENSFKHVEVKYDEIPGRTKEFEKKMLKSMSKNKFLQEFKCAWISDKGTLINSIKLESLNPVEPEQIIGDELHVFNSNVKDKPLAMSIDVSDGIGSDSHAIQICTLDPLEQVMEFKNNTMTQTEFSKEIIRVAKLCFDLGATDIYYTVENNGTGAGVINLLYNMDNDVINKMSFISDFDGNKLGICMSAKSKPHGCQKLKDLVEHDKLRIVSERLITELKFFVKSGKSFKAESGMHDDLCMSMVLMMLLLENVADFEEVTYETFNEVNIDIESDAYEVGFFV